MDLTRLNLRHRVFAAYFRKFSPWEAIVGPTRTDGMYLKIQDAIDAGHKSIFVKPGTYNDPFSINGVDSVWICGSGRSSLVTNVNNTALVACEFDSTSYSIVENLALSTAQGGAGGDKNVVYFDTDAFACQFIRNFIVSSDVDGVNVGGAAADFRHLIGWNVIENCDGNGITLENRKNRVVANDISSCGGESISLTSWGDNNIVSLNHGDDTITVDAAAEDGSFVGNLTDGAFTDNSGTSSVAGNEEY